MDAEELISSIDIVDFISQFVDLEQRNGEWWGLSPFKSEKTPSFSVRDDPPFFYDYSSGQGGNVFTFTKAYYNCSSKEAMEILKKYAGFDGEELKSRKKMSAVSVFKRYSTKNSSQKQQKITVLPDNYMDRYEKRGDKLKIWLDEGISKQSMDRFQVYYDSFSDRIVYPIRDLDGKIVNIGGRTVDPAWKEKGQRKYCYFYSWGTINTIYGMYENMEYIKKANEIILFEGCKSVLLADSWGIRNTGAILTSHLSDNMMKILAQLGCSVVFALDKDVRIRDDKNIQKLKRYVNVYYLWDYEDLLNAKDSPVDDGKHTFIHLYNNRLKLR